MPLSMAELAVLETAVPQANLKYKRSQSSRTYERQVASRFPRLQKKAEPNLTGFAPRRNAKFPEISYVAGTRQRSENQRFI